LSRFFRSALFPLIVIVLLVYLASQTFLPRSDEQQKVTYSQLKAEVESNPEGIKEIVFSPKGRSIEATFKSGDKWKVNYPSDQSQIEFENLVAAQDPPITYDSKGTGQNAWWSILTYLLPFVLFFGFWIFLMNQVQGGGSKVMSFGKSRAKRMAPDSPKITFKDVAGVDEAVEELHEIKEFLENPKKFQALGARIPKGVLLYGPPGRPACRSSPSPAPTSSRCSSASAPRACATSSSRPSRRAPASSSWTRSTRSAATAAPASEAATTSASRR
jgi:cell division protease FtsH